MAAERAAAAAGREDPLLNWTRPEREECLLCMLPLPLNETETCYRNCCGKTVCYGCIYDQFQVDKKEGRRTLDVLSCIICPFCRSEDSDLDVLNHEMKLANAGNHYALWRIGQLHFKGRQGLRQDMKKGIQWWHRAAEAGSSSALTDLGVCYREGYGVAQNWVSALEYFQKAADMGNWKGFLMIGSLLLQQGSWEEGFLNLRKAVMCGYSAKDMFDNLRNGYRLGYITKEEYAFTLRENLK